MDTARSRALMYEAFAAALLDAPSPASTERMRLIAERLGVPSAAGSGSADDGERRFSERFLVASSPLYLPATESHLRDAVCEEDGSWKLAPSDGRHMTHVVRCYRQLGFEFRKLRGSQALVQSARPDHVAFEVAFVASVLLGAAQAAERGEGHHAKAAQAFADAFVEEHLARWAARLAAFAEKTAYDYYAMVLAALAHWVEVDAADSPETCLTEEAGAV